MVMHIPQHTPHPVYLGLTLDRTMRCNEHIFKTRANVAAQNSIMKKL